MAQTVSSSCPQWWKKCSKTVPFWHYEAWCLGVQAPAHVRVHIRTCTHTWLCPLYPQIIIPGRAKKTTLRLWSSSKYKPHCAKGWCRVTSAFHPKETECHDTLASLLFFLCFPWSLLRSKNSTWFIKYGRKSDDCHTCEQTWSSRHLEGLSDENRVSPTAGFQVGVLEIQMCDLLRNEQSMVNRV